MLQDFSALRTQAATFNARNPESRALQSGLMNMAKELRETVAHIYGDAIADFFHKGAVRPAEIVDTLEHFARLLHSDAPRRARTVDAPVTAGGQVEARVARLEFEALRNRRKEKASALWAVLKEKTKLLESFLYDGEDDWTWANVIRAGLVRATVIDWNDPDKAGLKDLEAILRGTVGNPEVRSLCVRVANQRTRAAALWNEFEKFAEANTKDSGIYEAYRAGFDPTRVCTLPEAQADIDRALDVFERYGDGVCDFARVRWVKAEAAKLAAGQTEFG